MLHFPELAVYVLCWHLGLDFCIGFVLLDLDFVSMLFVPQIYHSAPFCLLTLCIMFTLPAVRM